MKQLVYLLALGCQCGLLLILDICLFFQEVAVNEKRIYDIAASFGYVFHVMGFQITNKNCIAF